MYLRRIKRDGPVAILVALSAMALAQQASLGQEVNARVRTEAVGKLPAKILSNGIAISPDFRHVAFAYEENKKAVVVVDGVKSKEYPYVGDGTLVFSAEGNHFAYAAGSKNSQRLVLDGVEGTVAYVHIYGNNVEFSPDGKHLSFLAAFQSELFGPQAGLAFVIDGVRQQRHSEVVSRSMTFSADGLHHAYIAGAEGHMSVVADGREGKKYKLVASLTYSPDGKQFVYIASDGKEEFVVVNGQEFKKGYGEVTLGRGGSTFSSDSLHFAYAATHGDRATIVRDGTPGPEYDKVSDVRFSPVGSRLTFIATRDKREFVVVDGAEGSVYDQIVDDSVAFSDDGLHLAYAARQGGEYFYVVDGVRTPATFEGILGGSARFSPDGTHFAYVGERDGRFVAVRDGVVGKGYVHIDPTSVAYGPDNKHFAFVAKRGNDRFMVLDGAEGPAFQGVYSKMQPFSGPNQVQYLALTPDFEFLRVTVDLPAD